MTATSRESRRTKRIGLMTIPINEAGVVPLANLIDLLNPETNEIHLVTGNQGYNHFKNDKRVEATGFVCKGGRTSFMKMVKNAFIHGRLALLLLRESRSVDIWLFFMGAETLLLPILAARAMRKPVVLVMSGSFAQTHRSTQTGLSGIIDMISRISYTLADRIILYASTHMTEWGLQDLERKVIIAPRHFVDFASFRVSKELGERENLVGFVGRLSREKGVLNFLDGVELAIRKVPSLHAIIAGDGPLRDAIEARMREMALGDIVQTTGWVPHSRLPEVLNRLRLLVVPSFTEGLPNAVLEAMACGTPILATKVGALPELVREGQTGFLLADNSADSVADGIVRALMSADLERMAENARRMVEAEFTREKATARWKDVLARVDVR